MPKILTCNYCGARAALVLDQGRHELVCASCGAPLHEIKQMPVQHDARPAAQVEVKRKKRKAPKKRKAKKTRFAKMLSEVWDELEDIFD